MKRILSAVLLLLPLTAFCQFYQVDKGKLETLLQAYFYTLPACDSTVIAYQVALQKADSALNSANKVILLRTQQRDLKALEAETLVSQIANRDKIHKQELKEAKKKGFKAGSITTGIVGILVIILL